MNEDVQPEQKRHHFHRSVKPVFVCAPQEPEYLQVLDSNDKDWGQRETDGGQWGTAVGKRPV